MDPFTQLRYEVPPGHAHLLSADPSPSAAPTLAEMRHERLWLYEQAGIFCAMLVVLVAVMMMLWLR
jgi:hypothetical protein